MFFFVITKAVRKFQSLINVLNIKLLSCWEKQMLHLGSKVQNKVIYKIIKLELWFYEIHTKLSEIPRQVLLKTKMGNFFAYQMPT